MWKENPPRCCITKIHHSARRNTFPPNTFHRSMRVYFQCVREVKNENENWWAFGRGVTNDKRKSVSHSLLVMSQMTSNLFERPPTPAGFHLKRTSFLSLVIQLTVAVSRPIVHKSIDESVNSVEPYETGWKPSEIWSFSISITLGLGFVNDEAWRALKNFKANV